MTDRAPGRLRAAGTLGSIVRIVLIVVVIGLVAWGIVDRQRHLADLRVIARQDSVPAVQVIWPAPGPAARTLDLPGTIDAWFSAPIYAQVSGYVQRWTKDYGAPVKAGEVLALINTPILDQQFEAAHANLDVAETHATLATATATRWKALSGSQAVSQQSIDVQQSDAAANTSQVAAARHDVARYQALERFKTVVAPFDGVVTARNTDIGDYVDAGGGDANGGRTVSALFDVADIHRMRVFVPVPQDYAGMLRPGLTATVLISQYPGRTFKAVFNTSAQAFSPSTRTVQTELTIDNADHAIWPGTYASVHFVIPSDPHLLIIPEQALLFGDKGNQVAIVDANDVVHMQSVTLGHNLGENVQVLGGLNADQRLVLNPSASILDGQRVFVVPGAPGIAPAGDFLRTQPAGQGLAEKAPQGAGAEKATPVARLTSRSQ